MAGIGNVSGTPVEFVPVWIGDAWRLVNICVSIALLVYWGMAICSALRREHRIPVYSAWGMAALIVFTVRADVLHVERWNAPLIIEGAPATSLALACAVLNVWTMKRASDRARR